MSSKLKKQTGFTVVELLIVVVVIAVLASISIVAFTGIQNRANDSAVQSDIANFGKKLRIFEVDNGRYPTTIIELNTDFSGVSSSSYTIHNNSLHYCYNRTTGGVAIGGVSKSGKGFLYRNGIMTEVVDGWPNMAALGVCRDYFGVPMPDGSVTGWRNPANAAWSGVYIYP